MAKKLLILFLILSICVCFSMQTVFATEVETTEPTEPTTPEENEDDTPGWLGGLKDFFRAIFKPMIDYFDSSLKLAEQWEKIVAILDEMKKHIGESFIDPVADFFDNLDTGALDIFRDIWELPIVKDYIQAFVYVCVVGAIVLFFTTV